MEETSKFVTYTLSGLLAEGCKVTINTKTRVATLIEADGSFSEQVTFSPVEYPIVIALFSNHPFYATREELLSAYSGRDIEACRRRIHRAEEANNIDLAMKDVRNVISRARSKMHELGIEAVAVVGSGHILKTFVEEKGTKR